MSVARTHQARKPRVTVKDLARELGMSTSTVSRAFYADAVIAPETREAVLKRAAEIGYAPNPLARSLITKRTRIAGVVVSDITNPFYPEVLTRLTESLQAIDLNVMLTVASTSDTVGEALRLLLSYQPDITIVLAATLSPETAEACRRAGTQVVFFNRSPAEAEAFGVTCDNVEGGRLVADHLVDQGHRGLAYVAGRPDASTNVDRWTGFRARCVERGLAEPVRVEAGAFSYEAGYAAAAKVLAGGTRPDGVFCANDILAVGFMDAARREFGIEIPVDLSVVGFDDINMASWPSHSLTTVRQPVDRMIETTIRLVGTLTKGSSPLKPRIERIPGELVERATTRVRNHGD